MSAPYYRVNNVDILPYLVDRGLKIEENDLDADGSGRTLDGVMHRTIVARKDKHTLKCKPLKTSESQIVLNAISAGEFVSVSTNIHPKTGTFTGNLYNSARSAAVMRVDEDGSVLWDDISFTLIGQ